MTLKRVANDTPKEVSDTPQGGESHSIGGAMSLNRGGNDTQ